jgi:hypothetical protein
MDRNAGQSTNKELRAVKILFYGIITGALLFLALSAAIVGLTGKGFLDDDSMDQFLLIVASLIAFFAVVFSFRNYKKNIDKAAQQSLKEKFNNYRTALILFLAPCEGATLFSVICFLLTANYRFLVIFSLVIAAMLIKRPTKQGVINDLQLDWQEEQEL